MARLHDLAVEALSAGNFIIEYAPGYFISGYSLVGLHSRCKTQYPSNAKLPLKPLKMLLRSSNSKTGSVDPHPLLCSSELFESDNPEEDD